MQNYIRLGSGTSQKMKFSIKDFLSKCDQIRSFLRIWSHLLKKSLMENFFFFCNCLNQNDSCSEFLRILVTAVNFTK